MEKEKDNKPKFVKRTALALSLGGALLATPAMLAGCQTQQPKDGANGKTWHAGTQDPRLAETPFGENGDFYFDEDNFEIYKKVDGDWTYLGKIKEDPVSVAGTTYVYGCDADLNVYVDITTHYTNESDSTFTIYPNSTINVGKVMTFEKAVEVAPIGATIMLKTDVELEETFNLTKRLTIDFNGHTISDKAEEGFTFAGDSLIRLGDNGDLTLTDSSELSAPAQVGGEGLSAQGSQEEGQGGFVVNSANLYAVELKTETSKCEINGGTFVVENAFLKADAGVANFNAGTLMVVNADETPVFTAPSKENIVINLMTSAEDAETGNVAMFMGFNPASSGFVKEGAYVAEVPMGPDGELVFMPVDKEYADETLQNPTPEMGAITISLSEDMVMEKDGMVIGNGVDLTINLNGYSISAPNDTKGDGVFHVTEGGHLTIKGEGTINAVGTTKWAMAVWADGGVVDIYGGHYTSTSHTGADTQYDMLYVKNNGTLNIYGGTFECKTPKWTLNSHDTQTGTINVCGGTFVNYNPAKAETEPGGLVSFVNDANYVVASLTKEGSDDVYYQVETLDKLAQSLANFEDGYKASIKLTDHINLEKVVKFTNVNLTIDLNGYMITNTNPLWVDTDEINDWSLISVGENAIVEISDSSEEGDGGVLALANDCFAVDVVDGGQLTINGGRFKGNISAVYAFEGDVVVNGGEFSIEQLGSTNDERYTLNCYDSSYTSGDATITVNGGAFKNFNPANNLAEGKGTNFIGSGEAVAYVNPDADNVYYEVCSMAQAVSMLAELQNSGMKAHLMLTDDIVLNNVVAVTNVNLTIDLNGHRISNETEIYNKENRIWSLLSVGEGAVVEINDSSEGKTGGLFGLENDVYAADVRDGGKLTLNAGEYQGNVSAVYVREGDLVVNGGKFSIQQLSSHGDERFTLNCYDSSYTSGEATIIVNGGTFKKFDPSANAAETNVPNNYVAEGCGVIKDGDWYTAVPSASTIATTTWFDEAEPAQNEFTLSTKEELAGLAQLVNKGNNFKGKTIKLGANIDLAGYNWVPIGVQPGDSTCTNFQGDFDGQNFTVSNITIVNYVGGSSVANASSGVGLFGATYNNSIKNIKVSGAHVKGNHYVGALVGWSTFTSFENCSVETAEVSCVYHNEDDSGDKAGALVGLLQQGTATNCSATNSTVSAGRDAGQVFGCLAGYTTLTYLTDCEATDVVVSDNGTGEGTNIQNEVFGRDRRTTPVEE